MVTLPRRRNTTARGCLEYRFTHGADGDLSLLSSSQSLVSPLPCRFQVEADKCELVVPRIRSPTTDRKYNATETNTKTET
jgi:hypothetical protein